MFLSAGILCYTNTETGVLWLLGQEGRSESWSHFGGRMESAESPKQTAIREFLEETMGIIPRLQTTEEVEQRLDTGCTLIQGNLYGQPLLRRICFVFEIEYDPSIIALFDQERIKKLDDPNTARHILEKQRLAWFGADDIQFQSYRRKLYHFDAMFKILIRWLQRRLAQIEVGRTYYIIDDEDVRNFPHDTWRKVA